MLQSISISNFILIDELEVNLKPGFTALTGETGAGKSIIIDAMLIALGDRASAKLIKNPSKPSTITLIINSLGLHELSAKLETLGIDMSTELIIRRTLYNDGKTKAYINDTPVSVTLLSGIREYLIELCGQHDSRGLLNTGTHIDLLDKYIGNEEDTYTLKGIYQAYSSLKDKLDTLTQKNQKVEIELEFLNYAINELKRLSLKPDEETELIERRKLLQDSAKAQEAYIKATSMINSGQLSSEISRIQRELEKFPGFFAEVCAALNRTFLELDETKHVLEKLSSTFGNSSTELEQIEERLHILRGLARKYGTTPNNLMAVLTEKENDLEALKNLTHRINVTTKELESIKEEYIKLASKISLIRISKAKDLEKSVLEALADLKMLQADFKVDITSTNDESSWGESGIDSVRFLIRTNPGSLYGPLDKIASGGELSRIMLALKAGLAAVKSVPILIFDEIDTGISGAVSESVGRKIASLAARYQVLAVTHQPQVAAFCDNHLFIEKIFYHDSTDITVKELSKSDRVNEVARMLSGEIITNESIAAATKLISSAA